MTLTSPLNLGLKKRYGSYLSRYTRSYITYKIVQKLDRLRTQIVVERTRNLEVVEELEMKKAVMEDVSFPPSLSLFLHADL